MFTLQWKYKFRFAKRSQNYNFKAKDSSLNACPLCFGNISKNFTIDRILNQIGVCTIFPLI